MSITQNDKICQVKIETLVIGIDIASEIHYARAFNYRGVEVGKVFNFSNDEEGFKRFDKWINDLMSKNSMKDAILGAEPTGHYWFTLGQYFKDKYKIVLVNPMHVKRTKELDDNNPSKTDMKDPKTIAKLVIDGRYMEPYMPEDIYAEIRNVNNNRLRVTKEMNIISNRIRRWLAIYFPEYNTVFGNWSCISSLEVLKMCPLPEEIVKVGAEKINAVWREKKIRAIGIKRAKRLVEAAEGSVGIRSGLTGAKQEMDILIEDYLRKEYQLEKITEMLENLIRQIPNIEKVLEIKGVGLMTVATFVAETGDIKRFDSPKQLQKLAGYAIRENSSGKHKGQSSISKRGRKRLRQALFQVILPLIRSNAEFRELHQYYTTRRKNPLKKKQSVVALSCKLIRIFYVILKKGVKYNAEKFVSDIIRDPEYVA
jgi:transposase